MSAEAHKLSYVNSRGTLMLNYGNKRSIPWINNSAANAHTHINAFTQMIPQSTWLIIKVLMKIKQPADTLRIPSAFFQSA